MEWTSGQLAYRGLTPSVHKTLDLGAVLAS
jgi:hypothetical protein